jgi:hypothetical protein
MFSSNNGSYKSVGNQADLLFSYAYSVLPGFKVFKRNFNLAFGMHHSEESAECTPSQNGLIPK